MVITKKHQTWSIKTVKLKFSIHCTNILSLGICELFSEGWITKVLIKRQTCRFYFQVRERFKQIIVRIYNLPDLHNLAAFDGLRCKWEENF